jgi:hypothetical protein
MTSIFMVEKYAKKETIIKQEANKVDFMLVSSFSALRW